MTPSLAQDSGASNDTHKIVDLFAGPGGLDVAARQLGIEADGIEWDPNACATRIANGLSTYAGDVQDFNPAGFPDATILAGGPPCQTYTVAGSGTGRRALENVLTLAKLMAARQDVPDALRARIDERTGLVLEPLRWALAAKDAGRPFKAIVLEQVPAVLPVWITIAEALRAEGYKVACQVLKTEMYGVPQTRRRAVLIARLDAPAFLPEATHRPYRKGVARTDGDPNLLPWVSMGSVLNRPGRFKVISNYGTGGDPKARGERRSDEPSATVTGKIRRNRIMSHTGRELPRLSYPEAGLLQTFPPEHVWDGNDVAQQIGNAIPPRLARHVLAAALGGKVDAETATIFSPLSAEACESLSPRLF